MKTRDIKESRSSGLKLFIVVGLFLLYALHSTNAEAKGVSELKKKYDNFIRSIASDYNIDPQLIHSIILVESNYNKYAVSSKGAMGLMQLMPETAKDYGVRNIFDPYENIKAGVKHLNYLINLYNGNRDLYLAAYNAGQEAVEKHAGVPPYRETINYIRKVKASYNKNRLASRRNSRIYKFYDESGKVVLTNDPRLYAAYKNKTPK